jgi:hypothetical protein
MKDMPSAQGLDGDDVWKKKLNMDFKKYVILIPT